MDFDLRFEGCKIKADWVTIVKHSALVGIGEEIPAEHVQDIGLVSGGYHWPGELQHRIGLRGL